MKIARAVLLLMMALLPVRGHSKSSPGSKDPVSLIKAAKQLLEKERQQQSGVKCKTSTNQHISQLRVNGQVEEAVACLLQSLTKDASEGWKWSQLAALYAQSGSKSKAKTCFKQATKLDGKISQALEWHVLAPFITGKPELDGDPLEAFGGIRSAASQRFNKKKVYYSELATGGEISWKSYEQVPGHPVQISPKIDWGDLINSLGAMAVTEWQGWAVGDFAVNTEREDVLIQCLGVPAVYVDDYLLAGDVYRRTFFWSSMSLPQGIHSMYVRLRAKVNQVFQCTIEIMEKDFVIHPPGKVPDMMDGYLVAEHMPVTIPISNLNPSKWLTNVRFKSSGSGVAGITVDIAKEVSIAPGQTAVVPLYISQDKNEVLDECSDVSLTARLITSAGSKEVTVPIRCRKRRESFIMTFEDHDGSIQQAAVIEPYGSCDLQECRVVLTLHGTGVQAQNQADSYKRMEEGDWVFGLEQAWVLAPTRHGAHNWEGPGSLTAISALEKLHQYTHSPSWPWPDGNRAMREEVIFAGHSMGGHGAWHLATHYPHLAKAVISMAGWNTKEEYGDSNEFFKFDISSSHTEPSVKAILEMCFSENDVDKLVSNLKGLRVLARIGSNDKTVHPFFVRRIVRLLSEEGVDVTYSELKGKEHWWWDTWETNDGGVMNDPKVRSFMNKHAAAPTQRSCSADAEDCTESPSVEEYTLTVFNPANGGYYHGFKIVQQAVPFRKSTIRRSSVEEYMLTVFNPAIGGYVHGSKIVQQAVPLRKSTTRMAFGENAVDLTTNNVLTLSVDLPQGVSLVVDGELLSLPASDEPVTICSNSSWRVCNIKDVGRTMETYGPARRVAEKPFLIVAGTQLAATRAKILQFATYLANLFFLTSDTTAPVVKDTQLTTPGDRNLIILGNVTENSWTGTFLDYIPLSQQESGFQLNQCNLSDVGILTLAPNGREHLALILMGTSVENLEDVIHLATPTIPPMARSPFSNMIPEFVITGPEVRGHGPGGYRCTGFWGNHWEYRQELVSCIC